MRIKTHLNNALYQLTAVSFSTSLSLQSLQLVFCLSCRMLFMMFCSGLSRQSAFQWLRWQRYWSSSLTRDGSVDTTSTWSTWWETRVPSSTLWILWKNSGQRNSWIPNTFAQGETRGDGLPFTFNRIIRVFMRSSYRVEHSDWSRLSRYCDLIGSTLLCLRQGLCHNNKRPPYWGAFCAFWYPNGGISSKGGFGCLELVLYGIRELV